MCIVLVANDTKPAAPVAPLQRCACEAAPQSDVRAASTDSIESRRRALRNVGSADLPLSGVLARAVQARPARMDEMALWHRSPVLAREPSEAAGIDCDEEHIACFRRCWKKKPPWPMSKRSSGHYAYCSGKCLAEYMACIGEEVAERAFDSMKDATKWLADHPEVVIGTVVVVAGVAFIVATGGAGAPVLLAL